MTKVLSTEKKAPQGCGSTTGSPRRDDLELITLPEKLRKDASLRKQALNECDVALLLPAGRSGH
jgi:hypothetical protein